MVRNFCLYAALLLPATACSAQSACTPPTEFQPELCPIKLPRISAITFEKNGARSSPTADQNLDCNRFTLTTKTVRRYFAKAWQVPHVEDEHHTLDKLPCYASGSLRFADGRQAHWYIEQSQTGSLVEEGEKPMYLYCPSCKFAPFVW